MCLRCARRKANWLILSRWRCSNTASSPLCVRVGVNFLMTQSFYFFLCPKDSVIYLGFEYGLAVFSERLTVSCLANPGSARQPTTSSFSPDEQRYTERRSFGRASRNCVGERPTIRLNSRLKFVMD